MEKENSDESGEFYSCTPPELREAAKKASDDLLPSKSKVHYESTYKTFLEWKKKYNTTSSSETVLMAYFQELNKKYKPSSLWSFYSMLKSTINIKEAVDIGA